MEDKRIFGYHVKHEGHNLRCDFCNRIIPKNKVAYMIKQGDAQGTYHGPQCYRAALNAYRKIQAEKGQL